MIELSWTLDHQNKYMPKERKKVAVSRKMDNSCDPNT